MLHKDIQERHAFAFYYPAIATLSHGGDTLYTVHDRILCHRILHVVRLRIGDCFTLFDQHAHIECVLQAIHEKSFQFSVLSYECNSVYNPRITVLLPLLKKEAFEEALYAATELGANAVQLITTKKTQRVFGGAKESERIERIVQAAAEQSKNFSYPVVLDPISFEQAAVGYEESIKIFFDTDGCPLYDVIRAVQSEISTHIVLLIGPEGDLTVDEKCVVRKNNFVLCRLTPTILRAQQAVAVSLGAFRSMLRND
jgi:RsmE family RNA methyltransferase